MRVRMVTEKRALQLIDLDVDMDTNIQNIAYLGKIMSLCNKQHLSNIRGPIELKKYFRGIVPLV